MKKAARTILYLFVQAVIPVVIPVTPILVMITNQAPTIGLLVTMLASYEVMPFYECLKVNSGVYDYE